MISSTAVRVYIIVAIIPLAWWGARLTKAALVPPGVDMPDWSFFQMPAQFGNWQGEDREPDPEIDVATQAKLDTIVNRNYRDDVGHIITLHAAMFENPQHGVLHSPLNCLRSQDWAKLSETRTELKIDDELTIPASVTVWDRKGEKLMVVYWYQLGKHVLFGRWDLGIKVRWSLAGKPTWPTLIKVMVTTPLPASDSEAAKAALLSFAGDVAKWENQPSHRNGKGMLGTQNDAVDPKSTSPP